MPVAISFSVPVPVNSAAQFMDGAAQGVAASSATDANNSVVSLFSKDQKSSDEDFDAVLALLLNGGVPQLQVPVVPVPVEMEENTAESGATETAAVLSGTRFNAAGESNFVNAGQLFFQNRDSAVQPATATLGTVKAAGTLPENAATSATAQTAETANAFGLSLTSTPATAVASNALGTESIGNLDRSPTATPRAEQSRASLQVTYDAEIAPTQIRDQVRSQTPSTPMPAAPIPATQKSVTQTPVKQVLPIDGAVNNADAPTTSIRLTVLAQPLESGTAQPLTKDMIQALEQVGRPSASAINTDQEIQPPVPTATSQTSTMPKSGPLMVEPQLATELAPVLKPILVASTKTATTTTVVSSEAAADQHLSLSFKSQAPVSSLTNTASQSAETQVLTSWPRSSEVQTGITATSKSTESAPGSTAVTLDLTSTAAEQLPPSISSVKRRAQPSVDSVVSDESRPQLSSQSDTTLAAAQSSLISPASPNSVPDLAASISAEMRKPLTSQVSQAIMDHVERHGVRQSDSLSVRLDPPELGEMTIQLSKTHDGLAVRVTAREAVTMDMLFARGQEIESQLRGQHMNLKSLEFQRTDMFSSGFSQGQGQQQQQGNSSRRSENLLNQIRGGTRGLSPVSNSHPRGVTSESNYGLSFRA